MYHVPIIIHGVRRWKAQRNFITLNRTYEKAGIDITLQFGFIRPEPGAGTCTQYKGSGLHVGKMDYT